MRWPLLKSDVNRLKKHFVLAGYAGLLSGGHAMKNSRKLLDQSRTRMEFLRLFLLADPEYMVLSSNNKHTG
jgi:hypothetical protein